MKTFVTPPTENGRYSNGWYPQLVDEWLAYGNSTVFVRNIRTGAVREFPPPAGKQAWPVGLERGADGVVRLGVTTDVGNLLRAFATIDVATGAITPAAIDPATFPVLLCGGAVWGYQATSGRPDDWLYFKNGTVFSFDVPGRLYGAPRGRQGWLVLMQPGRQWAEVVVDGATGALVHELPIGASRAELRLGPGGRPFISYVLGGRNVVVAPDGAVTLFDPPAGADWSGPGMPAFRHGELWLWSPCGAGYNEQGFAFGRPADTNAAGLVIEMPPGDLQVGYDDARDEWTLAGMAQGMHGTPDYADGTMHCVSEIPGATPRRPISAAVTPFNFPIRIPAELVADVWTFDDVIPGTIGGGATPGRPQRQGAGVYADGRPWFNVDDPNMLGLWISHDDDAHGLGFFLETDKPTLYFGAKLDNLIHVYKLDDIRDELVALANANIESLDSYPLDRRMCVELCRRHGWSLTTYSDKQPDDRERGYFGQRLERLRLTYVDKIATEAGVNVYPGEMAEFKVDQIIEDAYAPITAEERQALGLDPAADLPASWVRPVILTLGRYTGRNPATGTLRWQPTTVARRLEWALKAAARHGALCLDVFGVPRNGELPEFEAWADRWVKALIAQMPPCNPSHWARTAWTPPAPIPVPTPTPVPEPQPTPAPPHGHGSPVVPIAVGVGAAAAVAAAIIAKHRHDVNAAIDEGEAAIAKDAAERRKEREEMAKPDDPADPKK